MFEKNKLNTDGSDFISQADDWISHELNQKSYREININSFLTFPIYNKKTKIGGLP